MQKTQVLLIYRHNSDICFFGFCNSTISSLFGCCQTSTGETEYYQIAWQMTNESIVEREFGALEKINDSYPKYLLTTDGFPQSRSGVRHLNVFNWLLETNEKE